MIHSYALIYEFPNYSKSGFYVLQEQLCSHVNIIYWIKMQNIYAFGDLSTEKHSMTFLWKENKWSFTYQLQKHFDILQLIAVYLMIYWLNRTDNSLPKDMKKRLSEEDQCNLFITSVETETYLENMAVELNLYGQDKD